MKDKHVTSLIPFLEELIAVVVLVNFFVLFKILQPRMQHYDVHPILIFYQIKTIYLAISALLLASSAI